MPRSSGQIAMPARAMARARQADQLAAAELDRALALAEDAHDRLQRRGLAGAVAAEERHDLAVGDLEADAVQHVAFAVPAFEVAHREKRRRGGGAGGLSHDRLRCRPR